MRPFLGLVLGVALAFSCASAAPDAGIIVSSPAFQTGTNIPDQFGCKGANVSPPLKFDSVPADAKSLAIIVDDRDAPSGLFTHWIVWNIGPSTKELAEKSVPSGAVQGTNDFGKSGYGGPCPPSGTHRYFFHVIALDRTLGLKSGAKRAGFDTAIAGHVIGKGELMGRYSHQATRLKNSSG